MLRLFKHHSRRQPKQRAVSAELHVAGLHECLAGGGAAKLDLTDVLRRVTNPNRKSRKRQIMRGTPLTQRLSRSPGTSRWRSGDQ
jgi:hypothetical protein